METKYSVRNPRQRCALQALLEHPLRIMYVENFLEKVEPQLPDLADTSDLIRLGIFTSTAQAVQRRKRGEVPEFLKLSEKRIVYPKPAVMSWLRERAALSQKSSSAANDLSGGMLDDHHKN